MTRQNLGELNGIVTAHCKLLDDTLLCRGCDQEYKTVEHDSAFSTFSQFRVFMIQ